MIQHLLIDFDRTLNDSDLVYERNLEGFMGLTGVEVRRHWDAIHLDILAKEPREKHEDLDFHYQKLLDQWRLQDPAAIKAELKQRIRAAQEECWDATALYDDALPFLIRMKHAGYTLHLATGDYAQQKVAAIETQARQAVFTKAFDESVLGVGKGKRDYFDRLLASLKISGEDAVLFGDSLHNDIGPAKLAGIPSVWVRRKNEKANDKVTPDLTITSLAQPVSLLEIKGVHASPASPGQP